MSLRSYSVLLFACACGGGAPAPAQQSLSIVLRSSGNATGTVTAIEGGNAVLTCTKGSCTAKVADGAPVTLTAAAGDASSMFIGWSGDCAGGTSSCTLTMNKSMSVTAQFRPPANIVFTTATALPMPFGTTAGAAQAAADAHCNLSATAAGLPGHYVAWLSTSTTNAISKLGAAHGWVRADGRPFTNTQSDLAAGTVFYPPGIAEDGKDIRAVFSIAATGTAGNGSVLSGDTCNDWTSTSGSTFGTGVPSGGSRAWTNAPYSTSCEGPFALYCFETSFNNSVVAAAAGRIAFVSKGTLKPGPGVSRPDADAICQSEAHAAGLPGPSSDYLALLATTGESAIARFSVDSTSGTWVRPDGVLLAAKASDIAATLPLLAPLDVAADGTYVGTGTPWTGSLGTNLPGDATTTCNDWGSTANSGDGGQLEYTFHWFDEYRNSITCLAAEPVYCFQK
jgi:hypothetical protein